MSKRGEHYKLCKKTAERFIKENNVVVFEYKAAYMGEHPDVLCYHQGDTTLFEIKLSFLDFQQDFKKRCRKKIHPNGQECCHLGKKRYYVCPAGLIVADDVSESGWGLYWIKNGRFYKKVESATFKNDEKSEMYIIEHAFRKFVSLGNPVCGNILIRDILPNFKQVK